MWVVEARSNSGARGGGQIRWWGKVGLRKGGGGGGNCGGRGKRQERGVWEFRRLK